MRLREFRNEETHLSEITEGFNFNQDKPVLCTTFESNKKQISLETDEIFELLDKSREE